MILKQKWHIPELSLLKEIVLIPHFCCLYLKAASNTELSLLARIRQSYHGGTTLDMNNPALGFRLQLMTVSELDTYISTQFD